MNNYNRHLRVEEIVTNHYDVKFRYVLAPIYLATYRFGKQTFPVAINGQTGETYCDVPTNIKKLIIFLIIALFAAAGLEVLMFFVWSVFTVFLSDLNCYQNG